MRKLFCAFFIIFSFSLFAQEAGLHNPEDTTGLVTGDEAEITGSSESSESPKKDLTQNYLAKSATPVNALGWTQDGKYFATSWNNSVILWNAGANTIAAVYSNSVNENSNPLANVVSLQFTSDGRYMLSVRDDNTVLIHSIGTNSDSTLISGTGKSIPDAVYAGDYRILLPLDGQNLYESFRLAESGQHVIEEKLDVADGIWALSASPTGKRLLMSSESGKVRFIDTTSWEELSSFDRYMLTRIKPRLAPDGIHFVAAQDKNTLVVASALDESDFLTLEDLAGFSYCAEFSSDSSKIVAGINSGCVKIYDIASGLEENSFQLMYGDSAKSLAFSPDDEYVIIGTEQGYIYRWVLSGEDFVPEDERDDSGLQNALVLSLGYSRLNSNYYLGSGVLGVGYRNYFRTPFFWGIQGSLGAGLPGSEFPYSYYEDGESLSSPFVYTTSIGGLIGLVYYNERLDLQVFSEAGLGANVRILYNNSMKYAHSSKPYFGVYGELLVGMQWKWARLWGGVQYDTNLNWLTNVHVGVAMPTRTFKRKKQPVKSTGENKEE
ncbi:WD40 repeat domain-containing protein [Treponema ruminis]|uniref:WD40 repeat protein n=1 Tax=Treponema ruminis TaxID=744515 RepID=A0A7W8LKV7_9SPIR|nr:WD40 repeat domain-containing protein [Treponema ruminis]MBB5224720.1 WD40 repeat protein [Treponema ruminis]